MIAENGNEDECSYPDDTAAPVILSRRLEDDFMVDWSRPLGKGTTRNVVLCKHRRTQQAYALKFMPKSRVSLHEIYMLHYCTVHCPEAVTKLEAVYENDLFFGDQPQFPVRHHIMVMEYMNAGTLFDRAAELRFRYTERIVSKLFRQVVEKVRVLHSLNIAHRDLKPENILIHRMDDGTSILKLTDFAFAHFDFGYSMSSECGTPEYQAPETQIDHPRVSRRGGYYTKACDIWSLGTMLYVLLSGTFPFRGQDVSLKLKQDYSFHAESWKDVSMQAQAFVSTLLCAPPRLRPSVERILDHSWLSDPDDLNDTYLSGVELLVNAPETHSIEYDDIEENTAIQACDKKVADDDMAKIDELQRKGKDVLASKARQHEPKAPFTSLNSKANRQRKRPQDFGSLPTWTSAPQGGVDRILNPMIQSSHDADAKMVAMSEFWECPIATSSIQ
eukprot:m.93051 g.93051  ORF g.93051 m.93051 type:complete len:445 (-) comp14688_c0_seq1:338-1672(-)